MFGLWNFWFYSLQQLGFLFKHVNSSKHKEAKPNNWIEGRGKVGREGERGYFGS